MKMNIPWTWSTLSPAQVEQIREAAWSHIERDGVVIQDEALLTTAEGRGAAVDKVSGRLRLPRALCLELMSEVPSCYTIGNILGESWEIGGDSQYGLAIVTDPWIIDYRTGEPRHPCLEDVRRHTIVAEQLEPVVGISRMDYPVTDVPGPISSLRALETHLLNHTRHYQVMAASLESFEQWMDVATLLAPNGDPARILTSAVAVDSPLVMNSVNCELLRRSVARGFAIVPTVCPMAGSTGPYSLAGSLLQSHIEALMVILMTQLLRPGHPVQYVSGLSVTDLQNGADLYYTMDKVLWKIAAVQLGQAESMPTGAECGGTMTYRYDPQSGAEGMLFMLAAHASGANVLAGFGSCHNAVGMSAEMMVIQQAYWRAARHIVRGVRTDDLRLAAKNLQRIGPGGHFLDDDLTIDLMRSDEFFQDDAFDLSGGHGDARSMLERAHERVEELLAGYESPVPHHIQEALQRYFHDLCQRMQ
ncbi:MAG: trimethylamine methyltransferase family protein [Planctomycetota bacterium]|jgi:trimethylamine--corrinoid protein Co-methyltransferase|nr:trimethylamine methyltransferase family protein [Planctomycetota bacterium]